VKACVLLSEFPNTFEPLEYVTLDEIVFTTNVVAVNVFATLKFDAYDEVAAYDDDAANEAVPDMEPVMEDAVIAPVTVREPVTVLLFCAISP
jgi:hypothetical protein